MEILFQDTGEVCLSCHEHYLFICLFLICYATKGYILCSLIFSTKSLKGFDSKKSFREWELMKGFMHCMQVRSSIDMGYIPSKNRNSAKPSFSSKCVNTGRKISSNLSICTSYLNHTLAELIRDQALRILKLSLPSSV